MKKIILALLSLTFALSASAEHRPDISGTIRLGDGTDLIRIEVNKDDRRNVRGENMRQRMRRLEMAVRQLQNRVYELEEQGVQDYERSFNCSVITCRKSESVHAHSKHQCDFFDLYKQETKRVYSTSGSLAERSYLSLLNSDRDVVAMREISLTCIAE